MKDDVYSMLKVALTVSLVLIIIPIVFYVAYFGDSPISNDPADWNQFSGFWGAFISIANLGLVTILTYSIHRYNMDREAERKAEEYARSRPILIFKVTEGRWIVKNIGNGPALNVLVSFSITENQWLPPVKLYSLMTGEDKPLIWILKANQIRTVYNDIFDNILTSTIQNDTMDVSRDVNGLIEFTSDQYIRLEDAKLSFRQYWDVQG